MFYTKWDPLCLSYLGGDFSTRVGLSVPKIFKGAFFHPRGPSVLKLFRGDFSTRVGQSAPKMFRGNFFHPTTTTTTLLNLTLDRN